MAAMKPLVISYIGFGVVALAGCFGPPNLPAELEVVLPNDVRRTAPADSGPELLAGQTWGFFRKPDADSPAGDDDSGDTGPYGGILGRGFLDRPEPDTLMFMAHFAADGHIERITDNSFYIPRLAGDDFDADGAFHAARFPGLQYASVSFGVSEEDRLGIAIAVDVRFLGLPVGTAVVYSWGTLAGDRIDGIFGYVTDFELAADLLLGSGGDQYPIYAEREP